MMILGIDLGMGACKLFGAAGGVHLPSHVAIADGRVIGRLAGMKASKPPLKVSIEGHSFYVGDGAHEWGRPVESLDYERLTGSPEIRAIVYGALTCYMEQSVINEPLTLYVGMPLEPLTGEADQVRATVTAVRDWLKGCHEWQADGRDLAVEVAEVRITSQPTGALFDYL
ncbi:MAG: hypothetical protein KDE31_08700, partial [Caldilineaceae bacterium]|nr:hypothetical protein [Caldilineaceae bacterium]